MRNFSNPEDAAQFLEFIAKQLKADGHEESAGHTLECAEIMREIFTGTRADGTAAIWRHSKKVFEPGDFTGRLRDLGNEIKSEANGDDAFELVSMCLVAAANLIETLRDIAHEKRTPEQSNAVFTNELIERLNFITSADQQTRAMFGDHFRTAVRNSTWGGNLSLLAVLAALASGKPFGSMKASESPIRLVFNADMALVRFEGKEDEEE